MSSRKSYLYSLLAIALIGCGAPASSVGESDVTATVVKKKAPSFTLTDLHGKKFSLEDFRGSVVFIDFWATWCPPCVMSTPEVQKMAEDYKGKKVVVLGISLDEDEGAVRRFVEKRKLTDRIALTGDSRVEEKYNVHGIPAFFVIDQDGNLAGVWEGYHPSMPQLWRKKLDKTLGAS